MFEIVMGIDDFLI